MNKTISVFLAMVLLCALCACSGGYDKASGSYTNKDEGISMQLPAGWEESNTTAGALLTITNSEKTSQIDVISSKLPDGMDFDGYSQRMIAWYNQAGAQFLDKGVMTIGDSDWLWQKMNIAVAGYQYTALLYHVRNDEKVYSIVCNTLAENFTVNEEKCIAIPESFSFDG
jgi:hypothetical protein